MNDSAAQANTSSGCTEEGMFPDPSDGARYYRCVREDGVELVRYDFHCGPGTYYHPETASCVHPSQLPPDHPNYLEA
ncbi:chitin binding peritrophin-A domain-containing protein [Nocardia suismassiliense]|uniref:chitin binding peritrophin-A domain-containing protein n=1 Tax=Nocardia suismassiliense TaxID=2077092 RepID=UPI000D1F3194|nr:chitin binding peritrophin-A domain-containing protein [Nocardia suismassiliense]